MYDDDWGFDGGEFSFVVARRLQPRLLLLLYAAAGI